MTQARDKSVLVVVRHGKPLVDRRVRVDREGYRQFWKDYEDGPLLSGQIPPKKLTIFAKNADRIFSSPAQRAVQTALGLDKSEGEIEINSLFIEAPLPPPPLGNWLVMRAARWNVISRLFWLCGFSENGESFAQARVRARDAALFLSKNYARSGITMLTGHGWFNRMLKKYLQKNGWRLKYNGGNSYWSYRLYER